MTITYDTWLESPYYKNEYDEDRYQEEFEYLTEDYMRINFKELDNVVMAEAIHEVTVTDYETLTDYLSKRDFESFGRKVWAMYMERAEGIAEDYAVTYIADNGIEG